MPQYLLDWRVAAFNKLRLGSHNKQLVTPYPCIRWSVHAGRCPPPHVQDGHGGVAPYLSFRLLWLGAPATRSGGSLSRAFSTLPASSLFRKDSAQDVPDAASAWPSARPSARPPFQLILAGSAVVKGLAPALRVIDGHEGGISVGRAHQRELHEKAFVDGVLEYVSRDHFTVKAGRDGHFAVSALSQNPMWHSRGSRLQLLESGPWAAPGGPPRLDP
eukprot:g12875.t1